MGGEGTACAKALRRPTWPEQGEGWKGEGRGGKLRGRVTKDSTGREGVAASHDMYQDTSQGSDAALTLTLDTCFSFCVMMERGS